MGMSGRDIQLSEAALRVLPYSIECKSRKQIAVCRDFDQAVTNTGPGELSALVIKENRGEPLIVLKFIDFLKVIGENNKKNKD